MTERGRVEKKARNLRPEIASDMTRMEKKEANEFLAFKSKRKICVITDLTCS